ncbi:MAG: aldehyde dehydrogenase family protein, partial [Bacteroidota bacterium]|nr:aldehyde dehydrogenase family protein [Bacteroidota bacterium]
MSKGFFNIPVAKNEPIKSYAPGSPERVELKEMLDYLRSKELELPMIIGGKEVTTDRRIRISPPHEIKHTLGYYYQGDVSHVQMAIDAAMMARKKWNSMAWHHRAAIFLKAADLLAGPY